MQFGLAVKHHDHAYVERRGGWELYTHLRAGEKRAGYRREALTRAIALYRRALLGSIPEPEVCGLGLLVLQRAAFAVEDLGGLLHAFGGQDPFKRLISTTIPDLDAAYKHVEDEIDAGARGRECAFLAPFRLPSDEQIAAEADLSDDQREAASALLELQAEHWRKKIRPVAAFWREQREVAKATMHGYPIVSGSHILGPPRAGKMAELIVDPRVPFAVALSTATQGPKLVTTLRVVELSPRKVDEMSRAGRAAADLCQDLCILQWRGIDRGYAAMMPDHLTGRLPEEQQSMLRELFKP